MLRSCESTVEQLQVCEAEQKKAYKMLEERHQRLEEQSCTERLQMVGKGAVCTGEGGGSFMEVVSGRWKGRESFAVQ